MRVVTAAQMKQAEQNSHRLGVSYRQLMENAGTAAFEAIKARVQLEEGLPALILCGAGNNGGDGFVIARKLRELGASPTVALCCGKPQTPDAQFMYGQMSGVPVLALSSAPEAVVQAVRDSAVIVDAVYGTGFHGELPSELASLFEECSRADALRFAVDIPSGVAADTGEADGHAFQAHYTLAMDSLKPAHLKAQARPFVGEAVAVDIGMAPGSYHGVDAAAVIDRDFVLSRMPVRRGDDHKGTYGKLLTVCGCLSMSGAAVMSAASALRAGAGLVTLASTRPVIAAAASHLLEGTFLPLHEAADGGVAKESAGPVLDRLSTSTAGLIGCGLSLTPDTRSLVERVVTGAACPLVVDADGLNALALSPAVLRRARAPLILTPHFGEMARLCGKSIQEIRESREQTARAFAGEYGVTLVLKGPNTLVASPGGELFVNTTGNPGMARGGSGDILAGMIASLLAQRLSPVDAACCGVYLHGMAGDLAAQRYTMQGMLPTDLLAMIPQAFQDTGIK